LHCGVFIFGLGETFFGLRRLHRGLFVVRPMKSTPAPDLFANVPESVRKLHEQGKRERRLRARKEWYDKNKGQNQTRD
jgi:hypothetical protein